MMNKVSKLFLALLFAAGTLHTANAQYQKAVKSADAQLVNDLSMDLGPLILAKEDIDKAYGMEGAQSFPKMWLVRAKVYSRLYSNSGREQLQPYQLKGSGYIAGESMMKYWQSGGRKKSDDEDATMETGGSFIACYNEAGTVAEEKDYSKLIDHYKVCLFLYDHLDTSVSNNLERQKVTKKAIMEKIGIAAYNCTDLKKKMEVLQELIDKGSKSAVVVEALSKGHLEAKDTAMAEKVIRDAMAKDPGNNDYFQLLINYYVAINRVDRLFDDLNAQIERSPESRLYYARGVLYEQKKENDKAIADYRSAIKLEELNYDANNNLGRLLLLAKRDKLLDTVLSAKTPALKKVAEDKLQALYKEAKGYLETAAENKDYEAKDLISIYKTLKNIAMEMDNKELAASYAEKIKALEPLVPKE